MLFIILHNIAQAHTTWRRLGLPIQIHGIIGSCSCLHVGGSGVWWFPPSSYWYWYISLNADFSDQEILINMYKFELNYYLNICLLNISHHEPEYIIFCLDSSKVASKVKTDLNACKSSSISLRRKKKRGDTLTPVPPPLPNYGPGCLGYFYI